MQASQLVQEDLNYIQRWVMWTCIGLNWVKLVAFANILDPYLFGTGDGSGHACFLC